MDGNQGVVDYPFLLGILNIFQIKNNFKKICFHFLKKWEMALEEIIINPRLMAKKNGVEE